MQYDTANRVQSMRRGPAVSPIMSATYTYHDDDRVESVTYSNDTSIEYRYDDGGRLTEIKHKNRVGDVMLKLSYVYDDRDIPTRITESDQTGVVATTDFVYDTRSRLLMERRSGTNGYRFDYTYDLGGNRLTKVGQGFRTDYHYDIEDPCRFESNNNRLEYYEVWDTVPDPDVLLSTSYYFYTDGGNVERVVTEQEAQPGQFSGVRMAYAHNGQAMTHAIGETWTGDSCPMQNWAVQYVKEFRYDGARQRYLNIEHDPAVYQNNQTFVPLTRTWTDYDGDEAYGDFEITQQGSPSTIANLRSFQPGVAFNDPWSATGATNTKYYHQDMIGTTRDLSGSGGTSTSPSLYTAFGERISGASPTDATRYGYAGAWGYQEHDDFPFLHVGARYYDPSTGRFMQRDPIGIRGGANVYRYTRNHPTSLIDPTGLEPCPCCGHDPDDPDVEVEIPFTNISVKGKWLVRKIERAARCAKGWWGDNVTLPKEKFLRRISRGWGFDRPRAMKPIIPPQVPPRKEPGPYPGQGGCFVQGTLVLTDQGLVAIQDLHIGDSVYSSLPGSGTISKSQVKKIHTNKTTKLILIKLNEETILCTLSHPFWAIGRGWVKAGELQVGDHLLSASHAPISILEVDRQDSHVKTTVYNLTVDGDSTYFVGTTRLLVHNKPP